MSGRVMTSSCFHRNSGFLYSGFFHFQFPVPPVFLVSKIARPYWAIFLIIINKMILCATYTPGRNGHILI